MSLPLTANLAQQNNRASRVLRGKPSDRGRFPVGETIRFLHFRVVANTEDGAVRAMVVLFPLDSRYSQHGRCYCGSYGSECHEVQGGGGWLPMLELERAGCEASCVGLGTKSHESAVEAAAERLLISGGLMHEAALLKRLEALATPLPAAAAAWVWKLSFAVENEHVEVGTAEDFLARLTHHSANFLSEAHRVLASSGGDFFFLRSGSAGGVKRMARLVRGETFRRINLLASLPIPHDHNIEQELDRLVSMGALDLDDPANRKGDIRSKEPFFWAACAQSLGRQQPKPRETQQDRRRDWLGLEDLKKGSLVIYMEVSESVMISLRTAAPTAFEGAKHRPFLPSNEPDGYGRTLDLQRQRPSCPELIIEPIAAKMLENVRVFGWLEREPAKVSDDELLNLSRH